MATPIVLARFGSLGTRWPKEKTPFNYLITLLNCRVNGEVLTIRPGRKNYKTDPTGTTRFNGVGQVVIDNTMYTFANGEDGFFYVNNIDPALMDQLSDLGYAGQMEQAMAYGRAFLAVSQLTYGSTFAPKQFRKNNDGDLVVEGIGIDNNSTPAVGAISATAGDVLAGTRYMITLFETETGYINGYEIAAISAVTLADSIHAVDVSSVPLGPSNTVRRIIAFTQVGASSQGPYYYIPEASFIDGLLFAPDGDGNNITRTTIEDNVTTTGTFSFPDSFLIASTDVTEYADKIRLSGQKSVFYSKTLRRMIWCGEDRDTFRLSPPDDPETYFGTTGLLQPGQGDGGIAMGATEFRREVFFLKNTGGFSVDDTAAPVDEWRTVDRWKDHGPSGPRAFATCDAFMCWASKAGFYIYTGGEPQWVSWEMQGNARNQYAWEKVNWDNAGEKVAVSIDVTNKLVYINVPTGDSMDNDMVYVVDYTDGWNRRRWGVDTGAFIKFLVTDRLILVPNEFTSTLLTEDSEWKTDNAAKIIQKVKFAYTPAQAVPGIYQLCGFDITAVGDGNMQVILRGQNNTPTNPVILALGADNAIDYHKELNGQNERWSMEIEALGEGGTWFELHRMAIWVEKIWAFRT